MFQESVTDINEFLVRDALREQGSLTRSELSTSLGLSPASISRIVRRLVTAGVVSTRAVSSYAGPGRKREIVSFNPRSACVIAVDLGGTKCHGALADLAADTLAEDHRPTFGDGDPTSTLIACIEALRAEAAKRELEVRAVVIGVPAVPDPDSGLISAGPNVNWNSYDLIGRLREHVEAPLRIENDVTLAAIGQAWRGEGRAVEGFVTISLGTGVGAAIFANGQIVRGRHNSAGEVGFMLTSRDQLRQPPMPALEAVVSGPAIAARARELLEAGEASLMSADDLSAADVFRAASEGDAVAREVIGGLLDSVAIMVLNIGAVLDPERVIFDGSVGRALEPYADQIRDRIANRVPHPPELCFSKLGPNATVTGAIAGALALDREADARRAFGPLQSAQAVALATLPAYGDLVQTGSEG